MKIKVGPHRYKVKVVDSTLMAEEYGRTFIGALEIWIADDQRSSMARETLLHEILHAAMAVAGLDKSLEKLGAPDEDIEEEVVRRLAPVILDVLRSNPRLVRTLLDKEGK